MMIIEYVKFSWNYQQGWDKSEGCVLLVKLLLKNNNISDAYVT